jgi:hypothetical protein
MIPSLRYPALDRNNRSASSNRLDDVGGRRDQKFVARPLADDQHLHEPPIPAPAQPASRARPDPRHLLELLAVSQAGVDEAARS